MSSTRVKVVIAVFVLPFVLFGVGGALALNSNTGTRVDTVDSSSGIPGKSWADLGAEQFAALPAGTQIVNCTPTQKQMQPGVVIAPAAGSPQLDPGFHFLIDGRCAFDPSALPTPMRVDWVEGTQPLEAAWWWTPITAVELSSLPAGTQIVNCWGEIKQLPRGVRLEVGLHFSKEHPGFYFLTDGRCALDPNAVPTPLRSDGANGGAPDTSTKAFDLQWFGTGLDGGPAIGGSTCFVGDPLSNHCGIETNLSAGPGMMATSGQASTPPPVCTIENLSLGIGQKISPMTQEQGNIYTLTNRGKFVCLLHDYPRVIYYDKTGHVLPFKYTQSSSIYMTHTAPKAALLLIGARAYFLVAGSTCDFGTSIKAATIRVYPPNSRKPLIGRATAYPGVGTISYCKGTPTDRAQVLDISPVRANIHQF